MTSLVWMGEGQYGTGWPGPHSPGTRPDEGSPEMTTLKLTARYARYLLTSLASVAFIYNTN